MSTKKTTRQKTNNWSDFSKLRRPALMSGVVILAVLALSLISLAGLTLAYKGKIYPNSYIGDTNFGGKTREEALALLNEEIESLSPDITIAYANEEKASFSREDIKLSYDTSATIDALFATGRVGSINQNILELIRAVFSSNRHTATLSLESGQLDKKVEEITKAHTTPAEDAKVILHDDLTLGVTPHKNGFGVDSTTLKSAIVNSLGTLSTRVIVTPTNLTAKVTETEAQSALAETERIITKAPLTLTADELKTEADAKKIFSWLSFDRQKATAPSSSPAAQWFSSATANAATYELKTSVDRERVKDFIANFAVSVDREPENAELHALDNQIRVTKSHVDGRKVNIDESADAVLSYLMSSTTPKADTEASYSLTLPLTTIEATVKETKIADLGIKELIGRAETNFKGSPANRIHNITTGTNFLTGSLLAPGEEFSTVKTLGAVDGSTGYLPELVIKENRTIPEYGGGLCQVSTTLFRAVMNAGLNVTERRNHSYRVSYYEPPVGMDATIYLPKPDFRFVNNTDHYMLIQGKVEGTKITFELYGTKDGRESEITEPVVTDITEPPAAIYTDTDTLKKGEQKQIEKPHPGATAVFTYTVRKNGQEINKQTFRSKYKAWPARYLVGTAE